MYIHSTTHAHIIIKNIDGQIMYKQIAVKNELKTKNELRDKSLAETEPANNRQASPIFSYNSLTV